MTQEKWAETPLARWIRDRMEAEKIPTKTALAAKLRPRLKITKESAERQVIRWTAETKPVVLDQKSRKALRAVLKAEPPDIDRWDLIAELLPRLIELLEEALERRPPQGHAGAASGP